MLWLPSLLSAALTTRTLHGTPHVSVADVGKSLGMSARWVEEGVTVRLESQWTKMEFTKDRRAFKLNGVLVYLGRSITVYRGELWIQQRDFEHTIQPLLTPQVFRRPGALRRIVIDAGHGAQDPGSMNHRLKLEEKHLALDLSKRLGAILSARGYEVIYTREKDVFIELTDRAAFANRVKADLFISVHFNAVENTSVKGAETYAFTPMDDPSTARSKVVAADRRPYPANTNDPWNVLAAFYVQRELAADLGTDDRGVKRARFAVLRELDCPGILIEGGFVTHSREGRNIGSAAYRQKMAVSIAEGILTYQRTLSRLRGE